MTSDAAPGLLAEDYWLATTGAAILPRGRAAVRLGLAMALLRDLEYSGDIVWDGRGAETLVHVGSAARVPGVLGRWLQALGEYAGSDGSLPARFVLDPMLEGAWEDVGDGLVERGLALRYDRRYTDDLYTAADVPAIRTFRDEMRALVEARQGVDDYTADLLLVAYTSQTLADLFFGIELEVPAALTNAAATVLRRDGLTLSRYRETVTHRDAGGWAYGPAARR